MSPALNKYLSKGSHTETEAGRGRVDRQTGSDDIVGDTLSALSVYMTNTHTHTHAHTRTA